jgi:alpha-glucosidase (family GH31 glycosyl hydrolase)
MMKSKYLPVFLSVLLIFDTAIAQNHTSLTRFRSASFAENKLIIEASNGFLEITPYKPGVVGVAYLQNRDEGDTSYSTIAGPERVHAIFKNFAHFVELKTDLLRVIVSKSDFAVSFLNNDGDTLTQALHYKITGAEKGIDFSSDGKEAIYGGGSKGIELNKRGYLIKNDNQAHYGYQYGQTDLNISIPFLVSSRNYGLYMDNPAKSTFDIGKSDPERIKYRTTSGPLHFFFISSSGMDGILSDYTFLTGKQPLPPRWALGYISSRFGYSSETQLMHVVEEAQKDSIPLDAVVLDLYWYKDAGLMGNHSWDLDSFPHPEAMLETLRKKGVRVVLISEPYITKKSFNYPFAESHHLFTSDSSSYPREHVFTGFWAGESALLDIFKPKAQEFFWELYRKQIDKGVAGWWFDLGEPEKTVHSLRYAWGGEDQMHNIYSLIWARTAFKGYRRDFPRSRPFILIRSGYAGMQRYSTFPWSGDIHRSFPGLEAQIPIMLNMGLSGVGYMHSDAGGFAGDSVQNQELYSRWLEFAAFTPVMRTHAAGYPPEPIFWDTATRLRVTRYIRLRYQLLPYNYTLAYENTLTGRPLMMPVNYFEPGNERLANINDEYLWGEHILVAPVIAEGQDHKKVLFPRGEWIGFNDLRSYSDSAEVYAPVDSLPVFVKAGSIIAMTAPITHTAQYDGRALTLRYYAGKKAGTVRSRWYYDDGKDPLSLENGQYNLVTLTTFRSGNKEKITMDPLHGMGRDMAIRLVVMGKKVTRVKFSGKTSFRIDPCEGSSEIVFTWNGRPLSIEIQTAE